MSTSRKRSFDSCPIIESKFDNVIENNKTQLESAMSAGLNEMTQSCPTPPSVGGKSRRKRLNRRKKTRSKMMKKYKGGAVISLNIARTLCYLIFLGILGGMMTSFAGTQIGVALYQGIFLGKCSNFFSRLVDSFGVGSAICPSWNWYVSRLTEMFTSTTGFLVALTSMKILIASFNSPIPLLKLCTGALVAADTNNSIFTPDVAVQLRKEATDGYKQLVAQWTTITGVPATDRIKAATIILAKNSGIDDDEIEGTSNEEVESEMKQIENEAANMNADEAKADVLVANPDKSQRTLEKYGFTPKKQKTDDSDSGATDSGATDSGAADSGGSRRRRKTRSKSKYGKKSRRGGMCGCEKKKTKKRRHSKK